MNYKSNLSFIISIHRIGQLLVAFLLFFLVGVNYANAQVTEIDSLSKLLSSARSNAERIVLMNTLSNQLKDIDLEKSLDYAQKSLALAQRIEDKQKEVEGLLLVGIRLYETPKRNAALAYFEKGEAMAKEFGFKKLQADNLIRIGKWYRYYEQDSALAVNAFLRSLEVSKSADYNEGIGRCYAKLASFYTKYKEVKLCEEYLNLSAQYYTLIENGEEEIAHYYNEVGDKIWDYNPKAAMDFYLKGVEYSDTYPNLKVNLAKVHSLIGEPNIALRYLKEAFPYIDTIKQKRMLGFAFSQLTEVYIQLEDFESAAEACDKGIALLEPLGRGSKRALPTLYRAKGIIAEREGDDENALNLYTKSMEEAVQIRFGFDRLRSQLAIGIFYLDKDLKKSKSYCSRSYKTAKKNKYTSVEVKACDCLYKIYKKENASAKALKYYEEKIALRDSLNIISVKYALEINSKISKKNKQLAEQAYQKEIKDTQLQSQYKLNTILLIASLSLLVLIGFLTYSIKQVREKNRKVIETTKKLKIANLNLGRSNEELERFAFIASHDLKSPLRNIINFTGLTRKILSKEKDIYASVQDYLDFIENNGKRMNQLIVDLLEYSKISQDSDKTEIEIIKLNEIVDEISQIAINNAEQKAIDIEISQLPNLKWNTSKIYLLFKNIIENGLKYNESDTPTVKIYYSNNKGTHTIFLEDNGIGIEKEYFDKVFILFKRLHTHNEYEGTGLGLATCKKIVEEFGGTININSQIGRGTTFIIELPDNLINYE